MAGSVSRSDVIWLITELLYADMQISSGNKDRYVAGRRVTLEQMASRLLRVSRKDLERYLIWATGRVAVGDRVGALMEPFAWVRMNPANG